MGTRCTAMSCASRRRWNFRYTPRSAPSPSCRPTPTSKTTPSQTSATAQSVTDWPGTWYLTDQREARRDYAGFGEVTWDATSHISLLGGLRYYKYDQFVPGIFRLWSSEAKCADPTLIDPYSGGPCQNRFSVATGSGVTPKYTATYKFDDQRLVYATVSKGFRPGGTNTIGPQYQSDTLQNYEVGWKTSWLGNTLRVNGAIFQEDWKNFQFSYPGQYGIIETKNAGGARIRGIETSIDWAASSALTFGGGLSLLNPILTVPYCGMPIRAGASRPPPASIMQAARRSRNPMGRRSDSSCLPRRSSRAISRRATPSPRSANGNPIVQGSLVYQSAVWADLRTVQREDLGQQPAYRAGRRQLRCGEGRARGRVVRQQRVQPAGRELSLCGVQRNRVRCEAVYANVYKPRLIGVKFAQKF